MTAGRRRLLIAVAISIAIHETAAGLFQPWPTPTRPAPERVQRVTLRVAIRPTPTPTPPPPRIIAPPSPVRAAHVASHSPRLKRTVARTLSPRREPVEPSASPIVAVAAALPAAGAGTSPESATQGDGEGTQTGASAPGGGEEPCGSVTFSNPHGSRYDSSTRGFYVDVRIAVRFPDGHSESAVLDYPFYYPNEAANPWSSRNRDNFDVPMLMQAPPAALAAAEPPLVQYIMLHTDAEGSTTLKACP